MSMSKDGTRPLAGQMGNPDDPYGINSGPIVVGRKRYGAVHNCYRCTNPVRDQFLSRGPTRLVDAGTLRPHSHDWSRVTVPDPIEVQREEDFRCNARCERRAVLTGRVGIMAWSLCQVHAAELIAQLGKILAHAAAPGRADD